MAKFYTIYGKPISRKRRVYRVCGKTMLLALDAADVCVKHIATFGSVCASDPVESTVPTILSHREIKRLGGFDFLYNSVAKYTTKDLIAQNIETLVATGDKSVEECVLEHYNPPVVEWTAPAGTRRGVIE